jgi:anti-sigma B factor antagonist
MPDLERFHLDVVPDRRRVIIAPHGEFDVATRDEVAEEAGRLLDAGFGSLVIDLKHVTFLDSSGLLTLMRLAERAQADGIDFSVRQGSEHVRRLLALTGMDKHLPLAA